MPPAEPARTDPATPELNRPELHIVLLCASMAWGDAAREQASELGLGPIRSVGSPQEAITFLAGGCPPVSHLLLQPASAGDLLPELVDLTSGQSFGPALVVLGEPARLPHHPRAPAMTFVPAPSPGWLHRIIGCTETTPDAPEPDEPDRSLSVQELTDALSERRIRTRYQPIVRFDTGYPVGLEVLARLDHPQRGILQPDLFVPQLEDAGLAWPLTQAVITQALADWTTGGLGDFGLTMALNFPLDVLLIPEALTWLEAQRRISGIAADGIVIELTESRPVAELARLRHAISTLRGIGYGLAIDDVGPEMRDHSALLDLQFTALKLDKDLVHTSLDHPAADAFLAHTIAAARAANLTIIAEGVSDAQIWGRMHRLGVDQAQGFLVARPLPAAAVAHWHRDWCARLQN